MPKYLRSCQSLASHEAAGGFALDGDGERGREEASFPFRFRVVRVGEHTIDGREHWIDTTAQHNGWDVLPRDDRDRACYVTDPNGIRFAHTPKDTPADHKSESVTTINVASNGDAIIERETRYFGLAAWQKREEYADMPMADRRLAIATDLQDAFPRAKLGKATFAGLDDWDAPLVVTTNVQLFESL